MASRVTRNISLSAELEKLIHSKVDSGHYQSASEVVREGLRLLDQRDRQQRAAMKEVRAKIEAGVRDARRGRLHDGDEVFRKLRKRVRNKR